jgi:hypothetical protein
MVNKQFKVSVILGAVDKASNNIKKATVAFAAMGAAAVAAGAVAIKAASDFEETQAKFSTVFSSISDQAEETARTLSTSFGLSSRASKKLLSDTGDLLTGFGFTQQSALDLSTKVNKLAVDLASFTNIEGGADRASRALTKALLGEAESAKELGIVINQNTKEYKDLVNFYQESQGATLQQAKAFAALELATQQSKNAIGDFARTNQSFANQTRILKARLDDIVVSLGMTLLPVATKVVNLITNELIPAIEKWTSNTDNVEESTRILAGTLRFILKIIVGITAAFDIVSRGLVAFALAARSDLSAAKLAFEDLEIAIKDNAKKIREAGDAFIEVEDKKEEASTKTKDKILENDRLIVEGLSLRIEQQTSLMLTWQDRTGVWLDEALERQKKHNAEIIEATDVMAGKLANITLSALDGMEAMWQSFKSFVIDEVLRVIAKELIKTLGIAKAVKTAIGAISGGGILGTVGKIFGFADGTNFAPGGTALVGERGPELITLPRGSRVMPADRTRQVLAGANGINITNVFTGNTIMGDRGINMFSEKVSKNIMKKVQRERNT